MLEWVHVALGRQQNVLLPSEISSSGKTKAAVDFLMPLRQRRRNYVALLRLADLLLSSRSPERALLSLMDWLHSEFQIKPAVIALASLY